MGGRGLRPYLHATMLVFAVSGCGNNSLNFDASPQLSAAGATAIPSVHGYGNDWVYSSQPGENEATIYKRKRDSLTLVRYETLTSGFAAPMGMVATRDGRWYIANSRDASVLVYRTTHQGPRGPVATLDDRGEVPVNVDALPSKRLVAVSNATTTSRGAGSVSLYLKDRPVRTLRYGSDRIEGAGVAIDSSGNCYWSFNDPKRASGSIVEFAGCNGRGARIVSGIFKAGGLAFDNDQNLYFVDELAGLYKCQGLAHCTLITPTGCAGCLVRPTNVNLDKENPQHLWVADAGGYIDALDLTGTIEYTLGVLSGPSNPPIGIAPAPGD